MNGHPTDSLRPAGARLAAILILGATLLIAWWAWSQGAYFDRVFYPGALGLVALLGLLAAFAPLELRRAGPAWVALGALVALALWTTFSGIWSDVPVASIAYSLRVALYAAMFMLGLWLVAILRERMTDALLPLAVAGGLVGIATTAVLATGDDSSWYLHGDATLRFPIGYRNANAAFWMACLWPMLALAVDGSRAWLTRALAVAGGTMMIELAVLAQSRGSLPATVLALVVFIAATPHRLRAAAVTAMAALPAALALPSLLDVFRHGSDDAAVITLLRDSSRAIGITVLLSFALAAFLLAVVLPRLKIGSGGKRLIGQGLLVVTVTVALVGSAAFVARHGGPIDFIDQRVDEFTSIGYPDLSEQGVRYGANIGSNRGDFWRVSLATWADHPVIGAGAGTFEPEYLRLRRSLETPTDPHSVEMLLLSEQGLIGLALFVAFFVCAVVAALRSRRLGARAGILVAAALASGTQWLLPASYDWFWQYAGVTAPVMLLLGAAAAPALLDPEARLTRSIRFGGVFACLFLLVLMIPPWLANRHIERALAEIESDPAAAVADYYRAADLVDVDPEPLIAAAKIQLDAGRLEAARASAEEALRREPRSYGAQLMLVRTMIAARDPRAREELERLRELSPLAPEIRQLARQLAGGARR